MLATPILFRLSTLWWCSCFYWHMRQRFVSSLSLVRFVLASQKPEVDLYGRSESNAPSQVNSLFLIDHHGALGSLSTRFFLFLCFVCRARGAQFWDRLACVSARLLTVTIPIPCFTSCVTTHFEMNCSKRLANTALNWDVDFICAVYLFLFFSCLAHAHVRTGSASLCIFRSSQEFSAFSHFWLLCLTCPQWIATYQCWISSFFKTERECVSVSWRVEWP